MINREITHELLAKYLRNEAEVTEIERVEEWLEASPENRELLTQFSVEWLHIDRPAVGINKRRVWWRIEKQLLGKEYDVRTIKGGKQERSASLRKLVIKVAGFAAMVALLLGAGLSLAIQSSVESDRRAQAITTIETAAGQKMSMTLPDNTKVWLNSDSKIAYSNNFNRTNREIELEGEAYFDVTALEGREFVVLTSDVRVVVRGTTFDVSACPEDRYISVSLLTGLVDVTDRSSKLLAKMEPNEVVRVDKESMEFTHQKGVENIYPLWQQEQLAFYNADIYEVVKKIERWYGVEVELVNPTDERYTFSVKTETLRELLYLLNKIAPIESYDIDGKRVRIVCK